VQARCAAMSDSAREHNLRLLVRGGGHSYLGTSNSRDSLLIRTRRMAGIELQSALRCDGGFVAHMTPLRAFRCFGHFNPPESLLHDLQVVPP
jgi:hypothetical protein